MPIQTRVKGAFIHLDADLKLQNFQILRDKVFTDNEGNELNREPDNEQTAEGFDAVELLKKVMPDLSEIAELRKVQAENADLKAANEKLIAIVEAL